MTNPEAMLGPEQPLLSESLQFDTHDARRPNLHVCVDSRRISPMDRRTLQPSTLRLQSYRRTVRALQLDHSRGYWSLVSWVVGLLLLVVVPILRLCFVRAADGSQEHKLVFQPVVVVVGVAISSISFLFLSQAIRRHGIRGVLFLDAAEEEILEVRKEYQCVIELGWIQLAKLFVPTFLVYILQKAWFYSEIPLKPLPLQMKSRGLDLMIIILLTSLSWIFQTTTYLYTSVLFWIVCSLQEIKMKQYKELLGKGLDPEYYYHRYIRIIGGLQATSRRFRSFLALSMLTTVFGALASMYEVVEANRSGVNMLMAGEIVVLNLVNLMGIGLCLMSASKLAHLHRRIVKMACSMHAIRTFEVYDFNGPPAIEKDGMAEFQERLEIFCQIQDAWSRRSAFVSFISNSSAGISVYGFVLDRFFVHTSIGALLTTTWFILGRSLGS